MTPHPKPLRAELLDLAFDDDTQALLAGASDAELLAVLDLEAGWDWRPYDVSAPELFVLALRSRHALLPELDARLQSRGSRTRYCVSLLLSAALMHLDAGVLVPELYDPYLLEVCALNWNFRGYALVGEVLRGMPVARASAILRDGVARRGPLAFRLCGCTGDAALLEEILTSARVEERHGIGWAFEGFAHAPDIALQLVEGVLAEKARPSTTSSSSRGSSGRSRATSLALTSSRPSTIAPSE